MLTCFKLRIKKFGEHSINLKLEKTVVLKRGFPTFDTSTVWFNVSEQFEATA